MFSSCLQKSWSSCRSFRITSFNNFITRQFCNTHAKIKSYPHCHWFSQIGLYKGYNWYIFSPCTTAVTVQISTARPGRKQHAAHPAKWCPCPCPCPPPHSHPDPPDPAPPPSAVVKTRLWPLPFQSVSVCVHIPHLDCMPKILPPERNWTQLNRTEPKCTALHCHLAITRQG